MAFSLRLSRSEASRKFHNPLFGVLMRGCGTLLIWGLAALPGQAALELRVAIREGVSNVVLGSSTAALVRDSSGQSVGQIPEGRSVQAQMEGNTVRLADWRSGALWIEPTQGGFIFIGDRWYRGRVMVIPAQGGLTAVNYVDLEAYLYSVIGSEMPTSWPLEALKAQAVAARSYVLYQRNRAHNKLFDVDDSTASQVYRGLESEAQSTYQAVDSTQGQVLTYSGQVIEAVFHSSSGGYTENVEDVWQRPLPYLRSVQDYDAGAPVYQWSQSIPLTEFQRRISGVGNLRAAVPQRSTPRGRVVTMRLEGDSGSRVMSGNEIRQALNLRSTLFSMAVNGDSVQIVGRGFGHGLGMSQWGAHNMAQQGRSYRDILSHYYMGATLAQMQVR